MIAPPFQALAQIAIRSNLTFAGLAAKFGPEITLGDLTARFSYDCLWQAEARSKRGAPLLGAGACEFRRNPGRGFRFDVGHRSDLIPATIPK